MPNKGGFAEFLGQDSVGLVRRNELAGSGMAGRESADTARSEVDIAAATGERHILADVEILEVVPWFAVFLNGHDDAAPLRVIGPPQAADYHPLCKPPMAVLRVH